MDRADPHDVSRPASVSLVYLGWAGIAAAVAIARNLPAGFAGTQTGLSAARDFLFGMGTALSPPIWWMAAQAACVALAMRSASRRRTFTIGLIAFGISEFVGALGEPITWQLALRPNADPAISAIQTGMILLPLLVIVSGLRSLFRASRGDAAHAPDAA
jgi:hypothetical protein